MPRVYQKHPSKFEYFPLTIIPCRDFRVVRYITGYDKEFKDFFVKVERVHAIGVAARKDPEEGTTENVTVGYRLMGGKFHVCDANMWHIGLVDMEATLHDIHELVHHELQIRTARKVSKDKIQRTPIRLEDDRGAWYTYFYEELYPHADKKTSRRKR